jgi:hypothetical protein
MQATKEQLETLARVFSEGQTGYPEDFADYYIDENNTATTQDTLDDFRRNSREWNELEAMEEIGGGLFFRKAQALKGQQRVDVAVIDCGEFRLTYQQ